MKTGHIRYYIKYLRERGKYAVVSQEDSKRINYPDYSSTIGNYIRNIKVFFNYLHEVESEIQKNPCKHIENIKPEVSVIF